MKKYVKPELMYERYELTEQIAACEFDHHGNMAHPESCAFVGDTGTDWAGMVIFLENNSSCHFQTEVYCYYTGSNGMNTFNS